MFTILVLNVIVKFESTALFISMEEIAVPKRGVLSLAWCHFSLLSGVLALCCFPGVEGLRKLLYTFLECIVQTEDLCTKSYLGLPCWSAAMKVSAFDLYLIVNTIQAQTLSDSAQVHGGLPLAPGLAY